MHCSSSHAMQVSPSPLISTISMVLPSKTCKHKTPHEREATQIQHLGSVKKDITSFLQLKPARRSVSAFRVNEWNHGCRKLLRSTFSITERTCLCRFRRLGRELFLIGGPRGRVLVVNHGFHVAVTIIRYWWLKGLLEALLGGRSKLKVKRGGAFG